MKKLLILGASNAEVDVVKIAQSMGYYVIVTDYYTDENIIPAKFIADEAWNISWTDYDILEEQCRKSGVDGVLAGFSEFRVESMIEMCRRLNLQCYINREQLDITRDKNKFKKMCDSFNIPIVREYEPDSNELKFPVIIKPTDRGGSIGINVAYNREEYTKFLEYAYSLSPSKCVVVEDYIGDGIKFDCSYFISGDDVFLIETCDTTMLSSLKGYETLQKAWTFPSRYEHEYISNIDANVKTMLASLKMECGVANISFFYREGNFYVFEAGFRLGGGHSYHYQRASNGIDYLTALVKYSLNEPFDINVKIPEDRGYSVTYNIYSKLLSGEIVDTVLGEDIVRQSKCVISYLPCLYNGFKTENDRPVRIAMCTLHSYDIESILDNLSFINKTLKVKTDNNTYPVFSELSNGELINALKM